MLTYAHWFPGIGVQSQDDESVYFVAPDRFLGDQRSSYNQLLEFSLRIGDNRAMPAATDIILEGNGNRITNTIFAQDNGSPTIQVGLPCSNRPKKNVIFSSRGYSSSDYMSIQTFSGNRASIPGTLFRFSPI